MLKELLTIRNEIEHEDVPPPSVARCKELLDLMWYFLKSTDGILRIRKDDTDYYLCREDGSETQYHFSMCIDFEIQKYSISGWFPSEFITFAPVDGAAPLLVSIMHTAEKWANTGNHFDKLGTDVWIIGELEKDNELRQYIVRTVLEPA